MLLSFIVYTLLLLLSIKLAGDYSKINVGNIRFSNPKIIGIVLLYTIVCGIRYDVGVDYMSYWDMYNGICRFGWSQELDLQEPGWKLFTKIFAEHGFHFSMYFSTIALIQITLIILSFKKYPKLLPFIIFTFYCVWFNSYQNGLRQSITTSVVLCMALNANKINTVQYIVVSLLSMSIHKSAFIIILLYPILKKEFKLPRYTWILCIIYILLCVIGQLKDMMSVFLRIPFLEPILVLTQYDFYMNANQMGQGMGREVGLGFLLKIVVNVIIIALSNRKFNKGPIKNIGALFWLYYLGICISALAPTSILLNRPLLYLTILGIPVYAQVLFHCLHNMSLFRILSEPYLLIRNNYKFFLGMIIVISITALFYVSSVLNPEGGNMEYHVWF